MMRQRSVKTHSEFTQEIPAFGIRALSAFMVAPGEYTGLSGKTLCRTGTVLRGMLGPLSMTIYSSFIPFRLCFVDDEWETFMSGETDALPWQSIGAFPGIFEGGLAFRSMLMRRAFKLAYNKHFGDETIGGAGSAWYDNPMDDNITTEMRVRSYEQSMVNSALTTEYDQDTYIAPVAGATATISLGDMMRAMKNSRASERRSLAGDRYMDQMKRFGINLSDEMVQEPMGLGGNSVSLKAVVTPLQGTADAGYAGGTYWEGAANWSTPKRKFTEHGVVITFGALRHAAFQVPGAFPGRSLWFQQALENRAGIFDPDADDPGGSLSVPNYAKNSTIAGGLYHSSRFPHYLKGEHATGSHGSATQFWAPFVGSTTSGTLLYPASLMTFNQVNGAFCHTKAVADRKTPVR